MKLAINAQQLASTCTLAEVLDRVAKLDVHAVELWPHNLPGGTTPEEKERWETKDVRKAARVLRDRDMTVACVTLGFDALPFILREGTVADVTAALEGAVDAAETLGATLVNGYLAGVPASTFVEAAIPAARHAGTKGVTLVLENEAHDDSATAAEVLDILEAVDSPNLKTLFDPCNYFQAGEDPCTSAYETLKDHIGYVHFKGGMVYAGGAGVHRGGTFRGSTDRYIGYGPLAASAFDVAGVVRRLRRDGYDGFVTLEPHVPPEHVETLLAADVAYLRKLLDAPPSGR